MLVIHWEAEELCREARRICNCLISMFQENLLSPCWGLVLGGLSGHTLDRSQTVYQYTTQASQLGLVFFPPAPHHPQFIGVEQSLRQRRRRGARKCW